MAIDIRLTPAGIPVIQEGPGEKKAAWEAPVRKAFAAGAAPGLAALASLPKPSGLPPASAYWRDFASRFLTRLCHTPETAGTPEAVDPSSDGELPALVLAAPPMHGGEYLSQETLLSLWRALDEWARDEIEEKQGDLAAFLAEHAPRFRQVGRVCFHLAENKRNPELPFAFLATYASGLKPDGAPRYLPLSRALEEYAGAGNRKALVRLLSPIARASEKSEFVKALADGGDIYHPVAWTPAEAYRFLKEVPLYEASGLIVRLPDWWKARPRPRVRVTLDGKRKNRIDMHSILGFRIDVALGEETLDDGELEALLSSEGGLVFIKGQWVEADPEKLEQAMEHWERLRETAGDDGLTFVEGMRLLAGASADLEADPGDGEAVREWSLVRGGERLASILEDLRSPENLSAVKPGKALRTTLRPYQQEGLNWLWLMARTGLGACLADDMGLGKTVQVIALLLALKKRGRRASTPARPTLFVLPASLLSNWKAEIERFAPTLDVRFVHPSEMPRKDLQALEAACRKDPDGALAGADAVLTTYAMLSRQDWLLGMPWSLAVLDEAQAIRNPGTKQARSAKKIRAEARIALTGTPVENRLSDLWSLFDFLCPGLLGSHRRFRRFVKDLESRKGDRYAPLRKLAGPYILRRMKTDRRIISDLPDKTEMKVWCGLKKKQAALYRQLTDELREAVENAAGIRRKGLVLSHLMRLKQLCNHPAQLLGHGDYRPGDSGKFERLAGIAEEIASRGEKALVFTQFRELTAGLSDFLAAVFGRSGLVLHGGTPVGRRRRMIEDFQREDGPPFFVLSIKAGGTGLNLTAASHVILFDRWWNPAVESQATDRAFRIGQTKNVVVHKFAVRGTIEEKIDAMIEEKSSMASELLDEGVEKRMTEMSDEELIELVSLDIRRAEV